LRTAVFLDRDGTLIVDTGYPNDPDAVVLIDGAAAALRALPPELALVIISNQSGLARGLITPAQAAAVAARVQARFAAEGVTFAGAYHCPHAPDDGCACRKPAPGMLLQAARELYLDLAASIVVGDKPSDVDAAHNAGCRGGVLFEDWPAAAPRIASLLGLE